MQLNSFLSNLTYIGNSYASYHVGEGGRGVGQLDLIFFLLYQTIYVATSCIGSKRLYAYAVANFMHMILATHSNVDIVHMVVATYADPVQYRF